MKKFVALVLVVCSCFCFVACKKTNKTPKSVSVSMEAGLTDEPTTYNYTFDYRDKYFLNSATEFNKDLALVSFGAVLASQSKEDVNKFLSHLRFKKVESSSYNSAPTTSSIGFAIAQKKISGTTTVAVIVRGFDYDLEWTSNMTVGENGNHTGFDQSATVVYSALKNYIQSNNIDGELKLWIAGYSRGGAVANVLAQKILSKNEISTNKTNMFVYTFEAPRGLSAQNAQKYENVFNIVNSCDLITHILPAEYDLYRCGIDVEIYRTDLATLLTEFDANIVLPRFISAQAQTDVEDEDEVVLNFATPQEFIEFLIKTILREQQGDDVYLDMSTRENFVQNIQPTLQYITTMLFTLKPETVDSIITEVRSIGITDIFSLLDDNGVYNFLKPFIDDDGADYNDAELLEHSEKIRNFILRDGMVLSAVALLYKDNVELAIDMHFPEINYVLLKNYNG